MIDISNEQVRKAINGFLSEQYDKKTEKEQKQLIKAEEDSAHEKIAELNKVLLKTKQKYQLDTWMKDAANRMSKQLYFGTHISKGVHPDAKGDNVNYLTEETTPYIGTNTVNSKLIDANGNAAALPLAALFDYAIDDSKNTKIRDLIRIEHESLEGCFSSNQDRSKQYQQSFFNALNSNLDTPKTHERNKQMLWPIGQDSSYLNIIPLYPSVLTHEFYLQINQLRYSDTNKAARDNRFKKTVEHYPYISISGIAAIHLGGTKPQNISSLMSKQGGRNFLLPSLPPKFSQQKTIKVSPFANSIFEKTLDYRCREIFEDLVRLINTNYNNINIRNARKNILDNFLYQVISVAATIQQTEKAGWTLDCELNYSEKLWLDPNRVELEEQEQFKQDRTNSNWRSDIATRFSAWINSTLRKELKHIKHEIADAESKEWQKEMNDMISQSLRQGEGVFL
jgi:CRISPR-associated protein Csy1